MPDIFVAGLKKQELKKERLEVTLNHESKSGKFKAFNVLPAKVKFETQESRERIILMLRQHWVTQISWLLTALTGIFVPLIFIWVPIFDFMQPNYQFMTLVIWYLLLVAYIYESFISWVYRVFIITDERIIDINFYNLIYKELSEAKIDNIEDVTYRQGGVLRAMFNYGDVMIQTAGEQREFMIEGAPQPNRVVKIINELKLEEEQEKAEGRIR